MKVKQILRWKETSDEVPRKKGEIKLICDDESRKLISRWTEGLGYKYKHFPNLLGLIGIESGESITVTSSTINSVKCSMIGKEFKITLFFGDGIEHASEIGITVDNSTDWYLAVKSNSGTPIVEFRGEELKGSDGKELEVYCNPSTYLATLKIDENHILQIELNRFNSRIYNVVLFYKEFLNNYILSLDHPIPLQVYDKIIDIFGFSKEDIHFIHNISISYFETSREGKKMLSGIRISSGKILEYAEQEDEATYQVFRNGNWEYLSKNTKISYKTNKGREHYSFNVESDNEDNLDMNLAEILANVKSKMIELMKFIRR